MSEIEIKKLNIGCGSDIKEGWTNVDIHAKTLGHGVKYCDFNDLPLKIDGKRIKDNEYHIVLANNIIEHAINPKGLMDEIIRVCNGTIIGILPTIAWDHIGHLRGYHTPLYFSTYYKKMRGDVFRHTTCDLVRIVKRPRNLKSFFGNMYLRFKHWIESFIYYEYETEMKKRWR